MPTLTDRYTPCSPIHSSTLLLSDLSENTPIRQLKGFPVHLPHYCTHIHTPTRPELIPDDPLFTCMHAYITFIRLWLCSSRCRTAHSILFLLCVWVWVCMQPTAIVIHHFQNHLVSISLLNQNWNNIVAKTQKQKCFLYIHLCMCVFCYLQVKAPPPSLVFNRLFSDIKEEPGHPTLVHPRYYIYLTITFHKNWIYLDCNNTYLH